MKDYKGNATGLFSGIVEVWKDVVGGEGKYQVSSFGQVRSLDRMRTTRGGALAPLKGRLMKQKISKTQYFVIHLRGLEIEHPSVHRLVAIAFIDNTDNKPTVNHKDGNKQNNNVANLEWSTQSEQMQHAFENNLAKRHGGSRYSTKFKQEMKDHYTSSGCSIFALSKLFNVSERTASRIAHNDVERKHLTIKDCDIPIILELRNKGDTLLSIATRFGCGISQIHRITRGESRHVVYER
jgi:AraC-like DNA-binding protein